ncbi:MAG: hypothetical protein WCE63_04895 [Acidobacteriaceae bacterium]
MAWRRFSQPPRKTTAAIPNEQATDAGRRGLRNSLPVALPQPVKLTNRSQAHSRAPTNDASDRAVIGCGRPVTVG